ncbi:hypothetical protein [Aeoliella sp.]|uniref:hypothetical protein n=1 Tax=Aeoliella sp. TaxID=2795800 RepID=UPI003CCB922B
MPVLETLGGFLGSLAMDAVVRKVKDDSVEALIEYISDEAKTQNIELTPRDLTTLVGLLSGSEQLIRSLVAKLIPTRFSGVTLCGASGSGKSSICHFYLTGDLMSAGQAVSTHETLSKPARQGIWSYEITDTPGQYTDDQHAREAEREIEQGKKRVLQLVFAAGHLKTADGRLQDKQRPGHDPATDLVSLLTQTAEEEIEWIDKALKKVGPLGDGNKFDYLMIVINKMDLWFDYYDHVRSYYSGTLNAEPPAGASQHLTVDRCNRLQDSLKALTGAWLKADRTPSLHCAASQCNVFEDEVRPAVGQEAALQTMRLLRAETFRRFME